MHHRRNVWPFLQVNRNVAPRVKRSVFSRQRSFTMVTSVQIVRRLLRSDSTLARRIICLVTRTLHHLPNLGNCRTIRSIFRFFVTLFRSDILLNRFPIRTVGNHRVNYHGLPTQLTTRTSETPLRRPNLTEVPAGRRVPTLTFREGTKTVTAGKRRVPRSINVTSSYTSRLFRSNVRNGISRRELTLFPTSRSSFVGTICNHLSKTNHRALLVLIMDP